jgi:hypothetical protein
MKLALAIVLAPALAFADDKPKVIVDAPVHETKVKTGKDDIDETATRAGEEANLETTLKRQGFFAHAGIGPSVTIGGGTGTGGGGTFMLGAVVLPTWVALLSITANAQRHEVMNTIHTNDYTSIGLGGQWWPSNGAAHMRGTLGFGGYRCKQCTDPDEPSNPVLIDYRRQGLNITVAFGVDLVRFKGLVWGLDISAIGTVDGDGVITALGFQSYLSLD